MVKTSMLIEVSEEVNNLVVVPHKRNNTFSKLMATLLQGYIEDSYIRAYAEGTLVEMRKSSVDELDETLNSMASSLASLGIYTSELKSSTEGGLRHFNSYSENKEVDIDFTKKTKETKESTKSDKDEDLVKSVEELKQQNEMILNMMQKLMSGEVQVSTKSIEKVEESKDEEKDFLKEVVSTNEQEIELNKSVEETFTEELTEVKEDESVEESINASDILAGFLSGNVYTM